MIFDELTPLGFRIRPITVPVTGEPSALCGTGTTA